jgi:preprotein translocase subunit YajC
VIYVSLIVFIVLIVLAVLMIFRGQNKQDVFNSHVSESFAKDICSVLATR